MCGDVINVLIPSNKPLSKSDGAKAFDPVLSGRYLVTSLKHMVIPSEFMHSMVMTVMKDSVKSATPVKETNYPEPPKGRVFVKEEKQMVPKTHHVPQ